MKKSLIFLSLIASMVNAGGNIMEVTTVVEESKMEESSKWSYELEPYLMFTKIQGDASLGRIDLNDIEVPFKTIWDNLELGAMAHFEGHHDSGWGFTVDYGFMDLGKQHTGILNGLTEAGVRQSVLEIMGLYRQTLDVDSSIDYMAGIRRWDNKIEVTHTLLNPIEFERKVSWIDAVVGARYNHKLNENWGFYMTGSLGGAGFESDYTASVGTGVKYALSESMELDLQYKATWVDYEEGTVGTSGYFKYDTVTHGPIIGLNFKW